MYLYKYIHTYSDVINIHMQCINHDKSVCISIVINMHFIRKVRDHITNHDNNMIMKIAMNEITQ